jgi:hypothetical protein
MNITKYDDGKGTIATVVKIWNTDDGDEWIRFKTDNGEFTCRMEAFLARYFPLAN